MPTVKLNTIITTVVLSFLRVGKQKPLMSNMCFYYPYFVSAHRIYTIEPGLPIEIVFMYAQGN